VHKKTLQNELQYIFCERNCTPKMLLALICS